MSKHQPLSNAEMLNEIEHRIETNPNSIYPIQARWLVFRIKELEEAIEKAVGIGHNDDCILCGFKDKYLYAARPQIGGRR